MSGPADRLPVALTGRAQRRLIAASLCAGAAALAATALLGISGWFLTGAALAGAAGSAAAMAFNYLIPSAMIRLMAIIRTLARYGERLWSHGAALHAMADLRADLFTRLAAQDSRSGVGAPNSAPGERSNQLIADIEALEDLVIRRPTRHGAVAGAVTSLAMVALAGWQAAIWFIAMLALLPPGLAWLSRRLTEEPAKDAAVALGELRTRYVDIAAARAEIAAYGLADKVASQLEPSARRLDMARGRLQRAEAVQAGWLTLYGATAVAGVILLATASAPLVALAMLAAAAGIESMTGVARDYLRRASVAEGLRRIGDLRVLPANLAPIDIASEALPLTLGSHRIRPGDRVEVTGTSGSGKTRLLLALAGMRAPHLPLFLGEEPIADCRPNAIRSQLALAPQDAPLLIGTIADNLRLARPGVAEADMWNALEIVQLRERVEQTGLDTMLGEGGGTLSGGERKRLAFARTLLAERPWLLLDEPTEGLDAATETALVDALSAWLDATGTGLVLVSHRPAPRALARHALEITALTQG